MKAALTGGGTLGHIFPTLSVKDELQKLNPDMEFFYISSKRKADIECISQENIKIYPISSGKLRRYFSFENFTDCFKIVLGYFQARKVLKKEKPDFLFSKGGYVSVPVAFAASSLKIPIFTHESDMSLGLANRLIAKKCKKVFLSFPNDLTKDEKYELTGNPIRRAFYEENRILNFDKPLIVVIGGSLGAVQINNLVYKNLEKLLEKYTIIHQAGKHGDFSIKREGYDQREFITDELVTFLRSAHLVIGRSGANTLSELSFLASAMLLVPLSTNASRGDQIQNATFFEKNGAAIVLKNDDDFLSEIDKIMNNEELRRNLRNNAKNLNNGKAEEKIAKLIIKEVGKNE